MVEEETLYTALMKYDLSKARQANGDVWNAVGASYGAIWAWILCSSARCLLKDVGKLTYPHADLESNIVSRNLA
jgi:hypothetical protein